MGNREPGEDLITEPTVHLCWNEHAIRRAAEVFRAAGLVMLAQDMEEHLPTPDYVEPLGDVLVLAFDLIYKRQDNGEWWPFGGKVGVGYEWPDMLEEFRRTGGTPVVYSVGPIESRPPEQWQPPEQCLSMWNNHRCDNDAGHSGAHSDRDTMPLEEAAQWSDADPDDNRCTEERGSLRCELVAGHSDLSHRSGQVVWQVPGCVSTFRPPAPGIDTTRRCNKMSGHAFKHSDGAGHTWADSEASS